MAISRSQIASLLIPGLRQVFGTNYKDVAEEHTVLFDTEKSNRSFEEDLMVTGFGSAVTKTEGAPIVYDDAQEFYKTRYIHETVALGFIITEEAVEDDLYDVYSRKRAQALGRSMANTKQVKAADVFNNAANANFVGGDGQPLLSASHPTLVGSNQMNIVAVDLSETALEQACINISNFRDDRNILIGAMAKSLHIPPSLKFTAFKILRSDLSTTQALNGSNGITNRNDINALKSGGYFPGGHHVNHRFVDVDAWFIRTDVPGGTTMFQRSPLAFGSEGDFDTGNMKFKARERYSFGWTDWRQWYGSVGA